MGTGPARPKTQICCKAVGLSGPENLGTRKRPKVADPNKYLANGMRRHERYNRIMEERQEIVDNMGSYTEKRTRRSANTVDKDLQAAEERIREFSAALRELPTISIDGQRRFLVIDVPMTKAVLTYEQAEEFMDVLESKIAQMARHVTET